MALEETIRNNEDNCAEEGEVNLEVELISASCDLKKRGRKTNNSRNN